MVNCGGVAAFSTVGKVGSSAVCQSGRGVKSLNGLLLAFLHVGKRMVSYKLILFHFSSRAFTIDILSICAGDISISILPSPFMISALIRLWRPFLSHFSSLALD